MLITSLPSNRTLLPKQNSETVRIMADRWYRASMAQAEWAKKAKECVDFLEGRQWDQAAINKLLAENRPVLTFNKIAPLVRLVVGYFCNNRTDITYLPANEGPGTQEVAEILSRLEKQVSELTQLPFLNTECFMDGITTGRGFIDTRLDYSQNDFGEIVKSVVDPFTVFIDPDHDHYDLDQAKHVTVARWASLDEVEYTWGKTAADAVRPFIGHGRGQTWGSFPYLDMGGEEITPIRTFGMTETYDQKFADFFHTELIDTARRTVRVLDQQSQYWRMGEVFIDLETGQRQALPDDATLAVMMPEVAAGERKRSFLEKVFAHASKLGNQIVVDVRPIKRIRWTVMIGDTLVWDRDSIFDSYTLTGYYPYFRRGITRGMVEDMLDPQREINKRRSSEIDLVSRSANSGWIVHEEGVDSKEKVNWQQNSAKAGFVGFWRGSAAHHKPERINPSPPPTSMERLEDKGRQDLREVTGINESALGELDHVQSGRAIEARQRQAVIAIQLYMNNYSRTQELLGRKDLQIFQKHYTQERMFRILGEDGELVQMIINQRVTAVMIMQQWEQQVALAQQQGLPPPPQPQVPADAIDRLNDITVGRYTVAVDETPLSAAFANAQFEEMTVLLEKMGPLGQALMALRPDLIVDMSSLPRKEDWKNALKQAAQQQAGQQAAAAGGVPLDPATGAPVPSSNPAAGNAPSLDQGKTPSGQIVG